ncbi:unnamed protein product [Effrenium voratum]|nr:unnamed protein product [Effrenium voratum]
MEELPKSPRPAATPDPASRAEPGEATATPQGSARDGSFAKSDKLSRLLLEQSGLTVETPSLNQAVNALGGIKVEGQVALDDAKSQEVTCLAIDSADRQQLVV